MGENNRNQLAVRRTSKVTTKFDLNICELSNGIGNQLFIRAMVKSCQLCHSVTLSVDFGKILSVGWENSVRPPTENSVSLSARNFG